MPARRRRRRTPRLLAGFLVLGALAALPWFSQARADDVGSISWKPLAPRDFPAAKTLFVELPPAQTGVVAPNAYDDPRMWGDLFQEFETGSIGTGVAIGDYDGDGRPDIYVVSKTEGCRLFRNLGGYRFEDVTQKAGVGAEPGVWNEGASFVDINNDGLLDIYVCRFNAPNLLYVNQGDGTFKEMAHAYGLDVKDASVMAAFGDYDRDGRLDVYIVTNLLNIAEHPSGQRDYLFHNNGDGTFTNVTDKAGISGEGQGHSATWWDFDGDGWPDLYVANDFGTPDKLYHNNRDGTFTDVIDSVVPHTSFSSMGADLGDVNNDGRIDFLVADMAATTHERDQRGAADSRTNSKEPTSPGARKYQRNALFINTGTGRMLEAAYLAGLDSTDWTWSVRLEDLDNDGRLDLFVTNGMNREQNNVDLLHRMMAAETPAERIRLVRQSPIFAQANLAYRNLGDLHFENVSAAWGLNAVGVSFGTAMGDLSGDGNMDIVFTNYQGGVTVMRNTNTTGHSIELDLRGTVSNRFGIGSLVQIETASGTQARSLQLARGYLSSSEPMLHFGLGSETQVNRLSVTWPSGRVQSFEHLQADRRYTLTEPAEPPRTTAGAPKAPALFEEVSASTGLGLATREEDLDETDSQRLLPFRLNRRGPGLAVVEDAGQTVIALGGTTLDPLRVLVPDGQGGFSAHTVAGASAAEPGAPAPVDDGPLLFFDSQGNGRQDLLITHGGAALPAGSAEYQPRLFLSDGAGGYAPAPEGTLPALPYSVGAVAAADFGHEGRLGLFIGSRVLPGQYPDPPQSALLANRGGRFEDVTDTLAPALRSVGLVTAALWSDVDGDGWPDLLVATEWGGVRYFHNNQGRGLEDWSQKAGFAAAGTGWWTSLVSADFNGDGRPDYAVGNVGLNTPYHADPAHPALLFSGDFVGNGSVQLIEGYYEGDRLYPWRTRRDLASVIPTVMKRYPRNDVYARATLPEILGPDKLAAAQRYAATQLQSGVFLSQPDGTYRFEPLPRIAQIAPIQGMVAGDFTGAGHADLYAVQNSYAPVHAIGRFDGGLSQLLRGDGRGHFTAVGPAESGLVVPGDAKALAVAALGGPGPGFIVTRNNDTTLAFRSRGTAGGRTFSVALQGPPGNPTAVGAQITLELSDGSRQVAETFAGSGYYSQSPADAFFGYPDSTPPRRILVRWPGGAQTEHAAPSAQTRVVIALPAAATQP